MTTNTESPANPLAEALAGAEQEFMSLNTRWRREIAEARATRLSMTGLVIALAAEGRAAAEPQRKALLELASRLGGDLRRTDYEVCTASSCRGVEDLAVGFSPKAEAQSVAEWRARLVAAASAPVSAPETASAGGGACYQQPKPPDGRPGAS